jgi:hypothetical protein
VSNIATRRPDLDICQCGDWRLDHEYGVGRCQMPNDLSHGMEPCRAFTFSRHATDQEIAAREKLEAETKEIP